MTDTTAPSAKEVEKIHKYADTDGKATAVHHTLGSGPMQSAPGNHTHNGGTSLSLLEGVTISGAKGSNTALASVIAALVSLGATDTTTA